LVPPLLTVVTLGARDLGSLRGFYKRLGWRCAIELEDFAAFELEGAVLCLYPVDLLAVDGRVDPAPPAEGIGFSLAINVMARRDVDETLESARSAGARVTKEPVDAEWGGRTAYFADPEDNYWEIAWVPPESEMAKLLRAARG
jgi:uncharacterized protein